ncbi:MAG: hypothetical protein Q8R37_05145 [Nanoarchaeota archaeon]|nr:hypothetical protein [Nanoarchaeota archaeon]
MSSQEPIDCGDSYGFMAMSMVELIESYHDKNYSCLAGLPKAVSSFCKKVHAGLTGRASLEEIAHYRLACDALVRYNSMSDDVARETLEELVTMVPDIFHDPAGASASLDLNLIKNFFLSLAQLSDTNRYESTLTGKKSDYNY